MEKRQIKTDCSGIGDRADEKSAVVRPRRSRRKRNVEVEDVEDEELSRESSARKKRSRYK